jgi:hypothetical protein
VVGHPQRGRTENGLDATRTDALLPQPETGKISCVRHPHYDRLPLDAPPPITRLPGGGFAQAG